jgi:hypothetical protein
MVRPSLHIQNIYDALNPNGTGVNGNLKLKCIQLQNRVIGLANAGDIIVVSDDCPAEFTEYMLTTTRATDVLVVGYPVSRDLRKYIDARSVFEELVNNPLWDSVKRRNPVLNPYMWSPAICQAAREGGLDVTEAEWKAVVDDRLVEKLNDKAVFYNECENLAIPVPKYWIANSEAVTEQVVHLLQAGYNSLYLRQTRSGGALGNITIEKTNRGNVIREFSSHEMSFNEFERVLGDFIRTSFWDQFVISELLDLYASPGTLFYADEVSTTVICHTYQILNNERSFLGFMYPIEDKFIRRHFHAVEEFVHKLVEPWRKLGYRGYGNIDWMVTKDGDVYMAERNARQTAVISPLRIANGLSQSDFGRSPIVAPVLSVITRDMLDLDRPTTFSQLHAKLKKSKLLGQTEGIIITIPPSSRFGINSVGLMAISDNSSMTYEIYLRALHVLGVAKEKWLFDPIH